MRCEIGEVKISEGCRECDNVGKPWHLIRAKTPLLLFHESTNFFLSVILAVMASGQLHVYCKKRKLCAFEHVPDAVSRHESRQNKNALLFIGGLGDNFLSVPFVQLIAEKLAKQERYWSVFEVQLSSSGRAWGLCSLDRDVEELARCIYWAKDSIGCHRVVLMGHSTGSQDVLHYLYHNASVRPRVDGAILQAPVSDREALSMLFELEGRPRSKYHAAYEVCLKFAEDKSKSSELLPKEHTTALGFGDAPISVERFLSIASPYSPDKPSAKDLFSSDLSDERLRQTFGRVHWSVLTSRQMLILMSGEDEHVPKWVNMKALLKRWESALKTGDVKLHQHSGVVGGIRHNGRTDNGVSYEIVERCMEYLETVEDKRISKV